MQTFYRKIVILAAVIILGASVNIFTQEPPLDPRMIEKIQQVKKMRLLEILELDESQSDKFIVKYNAYEKKILDAKKLTEETSEKLRNRLMEKAPTDDLTKVSNELLEAQDQMQSSHLEKLRTMKSYLNEEQYAKFLVFENEFPKKLRKEIWKRFGGGDDDGPGPRRRKR